MITALNALVFCLTVIPILILLSSIVFSVAIGFAFYTCVWFLILSVLESFSFNSELSVFEAAVIASKKIFITAPSYLANTLYWMAYPFKFAWEFAKYDQPFIAFLIWFILLILVAKKQRF